MSSIVLSGDTSGTVTVAVPAVAGTNTVTIAAQTGTLNAAGPAFYVYQNTATTTLTAGTTTIITFDTEAFDTNNNFASNRFTPTVAGYYQLNAAITALYGAGESGLIFFKNGSQYFVGQDTVGATLYTLASSVLVYLNGSTDYVDLRAFVQTGVTTIAGARTIFQGFLVRGA
jgi:hypothetical protein